MRTERSMDMVFAGFGPWLEKHANEQFKVSDSQNCAFATYLKELGFTDVKVFFHDFSANGRVYGLPNNIARAIILTYHDVFSTKTGGTILKYLNAA